MFHLWSQMTKSLFTIDDFLHFPGHSVDSLFRHLMKNKINLESLKTFSQEYLDGIAMKASEDVYLSCTKIKVK